MHRRTHPEHIFQFPRVRSIGEAPSRWFHEECHPLKRGCEIRFALLYIYYENVDRGHSRVVSRGVRLENCATRTRKQTLASPLALRSCAAAASVKNDRARKLGSCTGKLNSSRIGKNSSDSSELIRCSTLSDYQPCAHYWLTSIDLSHLK